MTLLLTKFKKYCNYYLILIKIQAALDSQSENSKENVESTHKLSRSKSVRFSDGLIPGSDPAEAAATHSVNATDQIDFETENINSSSSEPKIKTKKHSSSKKHRSGSSLSKKYRQLQSEFFLKF